MTVTITCDLFSGKKGPSWELTKEEIVKLENLIEKNKTIYLGILPFNFAKLGYKGFIVHAQHESKLPKMVRVFEGVLDVASVYAPSYVDNNHEIEMFLCGTSHSPLTKGEKEDIYNEIKGNTDDGSQKHARLARQLSEVSQSYKDMAPEYDEGEYWNGDEYIHGNNCYNYATNKRTNTFAMPGDGEGQPYREPPTCLNVSEGVIRDGLKPIKDFTPGYMPEKGHVVVLYVRDKENSKDFHFYRRDKCGNWSHKPGSGRVTNRDNSNAIITNPESCDRGEYNTLCGYFSCVPDEIKVA